MDILVELKLYTMQDIIKREIVIEASKESVYDAIANPEKVTQWFPSAIEGTYAVDEQPILIFGDNSKTKIHVIAANPYEYFAYRWVPGGDIFSDYEESAPNTLVEFRIEEKEAGVCTVTMIESGFASLPENRIEKAFKQNSGGWDYMLGRLEKYFQGE